MINRFESAMQVQHSMTHTSIIILHFGMLSRSKIFFLRISRQSSHVSFHLHGGVTQWTELTGEVKTKHCAFESDTVSFLVKLPSRRTP